MITTVTKYKYKGKEFNSLKDIQNEIHNTIGEEVIDKMNKSIEIRHKDLFKLLEILCEPKVRETLTECYNATFEIDEDEDNEAKTINILDL